MIERFTEKAFKVILLAQEEAFLAGHKKLYPEHILTGLLREETGLSAKLLKGSGLTPEILRKEIKINVPQRQEPGNNPESVSFSSAVKKIIREARYEVQSAGGYYITPENIFLCLLREENASVVSLLRNLDTDVARIKNSVKRAVNKIAQPGIHPEEGSDISDLKPDTSVLYKDEELNKIMRIAEHDLNNSGYEVLGTEQLISAMLTEEENKLKEILEGEGLNINNFREKLAEINSRKDEYKENRIQLTPKAYKAVNAAYESARELGSAYIKPEHVLLGILREGKGLACRIMSELNIDTESLHEKILAPIEKEKPEILTITKFAREEARRTEQNIVGTEQLLLGIVCEGTGTAAKVLRNLGLTLKDLRLEVQKVIGFGHNYSEEKEMILTPRAKKVLAVAWDKAVKYKSPKIKSEHLLLAVTKEKDSTAMKVLGNLGIDSLEIRQGILNEIRKNNEDR